MFVRDVDPFAVGVDHHRVAQLFQQDPGKSDMHPADIREALQIAGNAVVAADDLLRLPGAAFRQQAQIAGRLVHVKPEGVMNGHGRQSSSPKSV